MSFRVSSGVRKSHCDGDRCRVTHHHTVTDLSTGSVTSHEEGHSEVMSVAEADELIAKAASDASAVRSPRGAEPPVQRELGVLTWDSVSEEHARQLGR
jgi:hypothetical protein